MRIHTPLSILTAFMIAVPSASALMLRPILILPASSSSSSSSSSSVGSSESSSSSDSSSSSSSSTSSSSSSTPVLKKAIKPMPKGKMVEYCKAVKMALQKGSSVTPDPSVADQFNLSIDMLTKAGALCDAMLETLSSSSSSSSVSSTGTSSSSGYKGFTQPNYNKCNNLGPDKTILGVSYCKYQCGLQFKIDACPKE